MGFSPIRCVRSILFPALLLTAFASPVLVEAQTDATEALHSRLVTDRLTQAIDEHTRITLRNTVHPLANAGNDRGRVADSMRLDRLRVMFKRSDAQEAALRQMISDLHTPGSASYHKWLTPDQFGQDFGPSDGDVAKIEDWLQSQGFSIIGLNPGRQTLEIAGTASQFRAAFHSEIHSYEIKDRLRYGNATDPQIPAALAPVFGGFASLNDFPLRSQATRLGPATYNSSTHGVKPLWSIAEATSPYYAIAPGDYAVQYDLKPLYNAAKPIKGDGQAIAIISDSNIDVAVANRFRTLFNLPPNPVQVIIDGNDPGVDGINEPYGLNNGSLEAYLDVEWAGAVAPDATIYLVTAADTTISGGYETAAARAVYSNIAPIIAITTGGCESNLGLAENSFWNTLFAQAAAQGITVVSAAGDTGSAGCDYATQAFAVNGQAINGMASTPYNVAVGGTDFYYSSHGDSTSVTAQIASYWNTSTSNTTPTVSLRSPIPEQVWNDSQYGLNISGVSALLGAGGGGASTCAVGPSDGSSCSGYPKPSWQVATGVPADGVRDIPDISLLAPDGYNLSFFPICANDGDCQPVADGTVQITTVGGTSVSAPSFAGIMALVDQKYGAQGQANYVLYPLAAQSSSPFNDVVNGTNSVPCNTTAVTDNLDNLTIEPNDCIAVSAPQNGYDSRYGYATEGQVGFAGSPHKTSYNAGTGYDLASGLGSVDAAKLVTNWGSVQSHSSTVSFTPSAKNFTLGTSITITGTVAGNHPTGTVAIMANAPDAANVGEAVFTISNGIFSGTMNNFPGGTYSIWAYYPGDSNNTASTSTPVTIKVTPEGSTTSLEAFKIFGSQIYTGSTFTYGQAVNFVATPQPASKDVKAATGSIVFSDNSGTVNTASLNGNGFASYTTALSAGSHTITASYSGDGSYASSTSSGFNVTVSQATPYFNFNYFRNGSGDLPGGQVSVVSVWLESNTATTNGAVAPTGTISAVGGPTGSMGSGQLIPGVDPATGEPASVAVFTIPAAAPLGTYNVSFYYPGDTNYTATSSSTSFNISGTAAGFSSSITASTSQAATSPSSAVQVTATVTGLAGLPAPTGFISLYTAESLNAFYSIYLPTSNGTSSTVTALLNSDMLPPGVYPITVYYAGDSNYRFAQTTITLDNSRSDFSLLPATNLVTVPASGVINDLINVTSFNSFAGNVFLTCSASNGLACSVPPSATLTSGGTVPLNLTINAAAVTAAGTYNVVVTGTDSTGAHIHTIGLQVVSPVVAAGAGTAPLGNLELVVDNANKSTTVSQADGLFISGWAADPTDGAPLANVKIYIDGIYRGAPTLGLSRPDVATYFNKSTYTNSGFNVTYQASNIFVGPHTVEVIATDAAGFATTLGSLPFTVAPVAGPPLGNLEIAVDQATSSTTVSQQHNVFISGWVADPADGSPLSNVKVFIDNVNAGTPTMGIKRPDVAGFYKNGTYLGSGYHLTYYAGNLSIGSHAVTVTGTDLAGHSTTFGPLSFTVAVAVTPPIGNLENAVDSVSGASAILPSGTLFVSGWAADYHDNGPAKSVQVFIDGTAAGFATLGKYRPDVASYFSNPAWSNVGWTFSYSVASLAGPNHAVIAVAEDSLGVTTTLGPSSFTLTGTISTVAGNGTPGYSGDGHAATAAELQNPGAVAKDSSGNLYIADTVNGLIRKVDTSGKITTVAGGGSHSEATYSGPATGLSLADPAGIAVDSNGNLYIADSFNSVIRLVTTSGMATTVAGKGSYGYSGDGGQASSAQLGYPNGIALDSKLNLYIADTQNNVIRMVTPAGVITTVAGNGSTGYLGDGGQAANATLTQPFAVAVDSSFNLYIADSGNNALREVTASGIISSPIPGAGLASPFGVAVDGAGNVYVSNSGDNRILSINPEGAVTTVAGTGSAGYAGDGGAAPSAELNLPFGVATDSAGNLYIADENNHVIRKVTF
jgi:trimeric autotransporter adhesin